MAFLLTADIGSTFTKLTAIDIQVPRIIATAAAFTTIRTDVRDGFNVALRDIRQICGEMTFDIRLAASSAAGGLEMISVGLVPNLTTSAAKTAAASAGAKVIKTYSYELSDREQEEIRQLNPDIILLSGGIDGGNKEVILANATVLAEIDRTFAVIVAGNKSVADEVAAIVTKSGKTAVVTENVMPEFNQLNLQPAKDAIRNLFMEKIIEAKGLHRLQTELDDPIIPTPLAVFESISRLSEGTDRIGGLGNLMAFDIGGATTDVYSCAEGMPTRGNVVYKDLIEPYAKRTVEADIGMRYSLPHLIEAVGLPRIVSELETTENLIQDWVNRSKENPGVVPDKNDIGAKIDQYLAGWAVEISADRHVGTYEKVYTPMGETFLQRGKDLTEVEVIVGTGGVVLHAENPEMILRRALFDCRNPSLLKPKNARFFLDRKNILTSMGLVGRKFPDAALEIMKQEIVEQGASGATFPGS